MSKGKNFSANRKRKDRNLNDLYSTPPALTRLLLDKIDFIKESDSLVEPCVGKYAIYNVLKEYYPNNQLLGVDIYNYETGTYMNSFNFLNDINYIQESELNVDYICTNPPYNFANEFIYKSKEICNKGFFMLLPLAYLHSKKRYDTIFNNQDNYKLKNVWIFTRYPLLEESYNEDGTHKTGMMVYAWYYWEKNYNSLPVIDWLDNNDFVTGSKKAVKTKDDKTLFGV